MADATELPEGFTVDAGPPPQGFTVDQEPITPTEVQVAGAPPPGFTVDPVAPLRDWQQLLVQGVQRNWANLKAAPSALMAMGSELAGDTAGMERHARAAEAIEASATRPQWELKNVTSPADFGYWLSERFGENALTLLTSAAGGGVGALSGHMLARGIGASAASRAALLRAGGVGGAFSTAAPIEAAGTGQERFQVAEAQQKVDPSVPLTTDPYWSLGAGALKGALEIWTPLSISRALVTPGLQLGKTIPGAIAKTSAREAATEAAQEGIDIYLRMASDPNYSFFGDGPFMMGEGAWRLAEATVAGGAIGGIVGTPAALAERRQESKTPTPDESGFLPGERRAVSDETIKTPAITIDGTIYTGATHAEAIEKAAKKLGITEEALIDKYSNEDDVNNPLGGFLTSSDRFVNRTEATSIAGRTGQEDKDSEFYKGMKKHFPEIEGTLHSSTLRPARVISDQEIAPTGEGLRVQTASVRVQQPRVAPTAPAAPRAGPPPEGFRVDQPVAPEPERAAVKLGDKIYTGKLHSDAWSKAEAELGAGATFSEEAEGFLLNG
ncbi:MAG: hypothetical protein EHM41_23010, partial [Chloroflexi bacterium]